MPQNLVKQFPGRGTSSSKFAMPRNEVKQFPARVPFDSPHKYFNFYYRQFHTPIKGDSHEKGINLNPFTFYQLQGHQKNKIHFWNQRNSSKIKIPQD